MTASRLLLDPTTRGSAPWQGRLYRRGRPRDGRSRRAGAALLWLTVQAGAGRPPEAGPSGTRVALPRCPRYPPSRQ